MTMTEEQIEIQQFAAFFGVCQSELASRAQWHDDDDDNNDDFSAAPQLWYDGIPDWVDRRYTDFDFFREYRTGCYGDVPYGIGPAPRGWRVVRSFARGGERECSWCGYGTGRDGPDPECQLCEGDGLIYLGSAAEVVYERVATDEGRK